MTAQLAAQYIRMSTDKQDLSPSLQKDAIAVYAAARGIEVIASYEDEGRSGVHLKNRPALLKLLNDVTQSKRFEIVLVYDVSRWGRFQDTDAAAYYEYHCRLHGAHVVYVAELFGAEVNPLTAMLKSMKRAMAAEYSRELANKARAGQRHVIARGFQMGALPPMGYRRCSVSANGKRRLILEDGQRKAAFTDRVEWVLAGKAEVELVRRICDLYARTPLTFMDIARLGAAEGWRTHHGRRVNGRSVATLLRNEALIGNFVWGRRKLAKSLISCESSRGDGRVPRVIDNETWALIQQRIASHTASKLSNEQLTVRVRDALQANPLATTRDLRAMGLPSKQTIKARLGPWGECLRQAGQEPEDRRRSYIERAAQRRVSSRLVVLAIAGELREDGHLIAFDGRLNVFDFPDFSLRIRVLWPTQGKAGQGWRFRVDPSSRDVDFDLVVRMGESIRPMDYFIVPPGDTAVWFPRWLDAEIPVGLESFWYRSPGQVREQIKAISDRRVGRL